MTIFTSISSIINIVSLLFYIHPIHVTVTEIEFDEKSKALEIVMRVFMDDLETTLRSDLKQPELDVSQPKNGLTLDQMAATYVTNHFKITLDNKPVQVKYLGHEEEGDAFIFYIEVSNVKKWKTIQIRNDMMTSSFEDQSNLVHVKVRGETKSLRLTRDTSTDKLTFSIK
jgi:hypothetical protein